MSAVAHENKYELADSLKDSTNEEEHEEYTKYAFASSFLNFL